MNDKRGNAEELGHFLNMFWHVEDGGSHRAEDFHRQMAKLTDPSRADRFKEQLAAAIRDRTVLPDELERWTQRALDSKEDVHNELTEVWRAFYGSIPPESG